MRIGLRRYLFACTGNRGISPGRLYPWPAIPPGLVRLLQKKTAPDNVFMEFCGRVFCIMGFLAYPCLRIFCEDVRTCPASWVFWKAAEIPAVSRAAALATGVWADASAFFFGKEAGVFTNDRSPDPPENVRFCFSGASRKNPCRLFPRTTFFYPCARVVCPVKGRPCSRYFRSSR